ncbi:hypothetical protein MP638_006288 [Amoeboaphelidium occidentale]|nr:hypothetical protein MP638_006288 [Amoeboaphelidium occidentale]
MSKIVLNKNEEKLCSLLLQVADYIHIKKNYPKVTLRMAGGWVRDKLMGNESHDADVTIDLVTGVEFAEHVHDYVFTELKTPDILGHKGKVAKIKSNPEKSKHLETANIQAFGIEVDFANLRSEAYVEGSRIPSMAFGTPVEDASRRDLTINALFYNLHSKQVEDHLGNGIPDLQAGIIRTPLPAYETFRDDPLRILRSIRFATRFGYKIVDDISKAAQRDDIRAALQKMVSKERVWEELKKTLLTNRPVDCFKYFRDFGIFECVLELPSEYSGNFTSDNIQSCINQASIMESVLKDHGIRRAFGLSQLSKEHQRNLLLAAGLAGYDGMTYKEVKGKRRNILPVVHYITKQSLKMPNTESDFVCSLLSLKEESSRFFNQTTLSLSDENNRMKTRLEVGKLVRHLGKQLKEHYRLSLLFSATMESRDASDFQQKAEKYIKLNEVIKELDLQDAYAALPILDGKKIMEITKKKPGPWLSELMDKLVEWQLEFGEKGSDYLLENAKSKVLELSK